MRCSKWMYSWTAAMAMCLSLPVSAQAPAPDPAQRCLELTRPAVAGSEPVVVTQTQMFNIEIPFEALAVCRKALSAAPQNAEIIAGEELATSLTSILAFGLNYPKARDAAVARALTDVQRVSGFEVGLLSYYLGSAYAYGAGVPKEPARAVLYFSKALEARTQGADIVRGEIERVLADNAPK